MEQEVFFMCPYCGENISMVVDCSAGSQRYIEDCEVCCRPIDLCIVVENETVLTLHAERA